MFSGDELCIRCDESLVEFEVAFDAWGFKTLLNEPLFNCLKATTAFCTATSPAKAIP